MSAKQNIYRVRGLDQPKQHVALVREKNTLQKVTITDLPSGPSLHKAVTAIGRVKLSDFLPSSPMNLLSAYWPTFAFFHPTWYERPIKTHPLALAPYLPTRNDLRSHVDLKVIKGNFSEQKRECEQIKALLTVPNDNFVKTRGCTVDSPVALALLANLLPRGPHDEAEVPEIIKASPLAAYILLHIGCRPNQRDAFIEQILLDPQLAFDLCVDGRFGIHLSDEKLRGVFTNKAHLLPLVRFARRTLEEDEAWQALIDTAEQDALAAAFAIGMDPDHERAGYWHGLVATSPEAMYWTLRVWLSRSLNVTEFPHFLEYQTQIKKDVRWLYHWLRDIDQSDAREAVRWHWPNPWVMDLIEDLKLGAEEVKDLYGTTLAETDDHDPWSSSVILWGGDYVKSQESKTNESSEDD